MTIPGSANPLLLKSAAAAGGYQIERSLRFNSADSAYLSRTPAVAGNRKKWTWSGWLKKSNVAATQGLFTCTAGGGYFELFFDNTTQALVVDDGGVYFYGYTSATSQSTLRDPAAWYHIVLALDSANATQADRLRLWVNGRLVGRSAELVLDQEYNINVAGQHEIGQWRGGSYLSGYLADIHFIDGQALDYTSFTEVSATTGQLIPKAYTGSFGTNGFWLKFSDNSAATATTLGKDYSGNSNNWTPNNLSVTAGAGNDSLVDTPTSYGTDTGAGGEVRGNYATWNPLGTSSSLTLANGNLQINGAGGSGSYRANTTIAVSSGKWYWEFTVTTAGNYSNLGIGQNNLTATDVGVDVLSYAWQVETANKTTNSSSSSYGSPATTGDIVMFALDLDNNKFYAGKNGMWFASSDPATGASPMFSITPGTYTIAARPYINSGFCQFDLNAGQRPFAYTAPSGFKALCDTNLTAPVVAKPSTVMDVKLYTGNGSTQTISGLGFSPDLVWIKSRSQGLYHFLVDTVRGNTKTLSSNTTDGESFATETVINSFDSSGFTLNADDGAGYYGWNMNSASLAAWCWDAGSSTVSNTQGSITSQVRANPGAGFSIATWTLGSSNVTVGHGLSVAPSLIICKARSNTSQWIVYHASTGVGGYLYLSATSAVGTNIANVWSPVNSTVFGVDTGLFPSSRDYVSYHFAPVAGYSSFGSYTGNGSASDGPFVFCNFRPRWVLVKSTGSAENWFLLDSARNTYNAVNSYLMPNSSSAEDPNNSTVNTDFLSNGFKLRASTSALNSNGVTYIYCAFAESPFQYARAR